MSEMSFKVENGVIDANADGGEYVPILPPPNYIVNVASLGILPTNTGTQNADAWDAAMAALDPVNKSMGARWIFGPGTYHFSRTLKITRQMIIEGVAGKDSGFGTRFLFPASTPGLHITGGDDPLGEGLWSIVRHLRVDCDAHGDVAHGILIHRTCRIEHVFVVNFNGDGIHIEASLGAEGRNANGWFLQDVSCSSNLGNGLFVSGADANGGTAINLNLTANAKWAVYDVSDLGNYYFGLLIEANGHYEETPSGPPVMVGGGIRSFSPNGGSVFVACYLEGDAARGDSFDRVNIDHPSVFFGGFHGSNTSGFTGGALHLFQDMALRRPLRGTFYTNHSTGFVSLGGNPEDKQFLQVQVPQEDGGGASHWNYTDTGDWVSKALGIGSWGSPLNHAMFLPTSNSKLGGRDLYWETNFPAFPVGFFLRYNRFESVDREPDGDSHPNRTWILGDKAFNRVVSAGGKIGWVCVTDPGGTLGTYTEGRTATADGSNVIVLDAPSSVLRVGMFLFIGGSTSRKAITAIDGANVTMALNVPAGTGLSLAYAPPAFKAWGAIDP